MNYLTWGHFCPTTYPGAVFYNYFNYFDDFLLIITCISIFLYCFLKKYKKKKLLARLIFSSLWSLGFGFVYFFFKLFFGLVLDFESDLDDNWLMSDCWSQSHYLTVFFIRYFFVSLAMYVNTRIWYSFIDKKKKHMKWVNIIFIALIVIILIALLLSKGTLDILNQL